MFYKPGDAAVSSGPFYIRDVGSRNGTTVKERRLSAVSLSVFLVELPAADLHLARSRAVQRRPRDPRASSGAQELQPSEPIALHHLDVIALGFDTQLEVHLHAGAGFCDACSRSIVIERFRDTVDDPVATPQPPQPDREQQRREELRRLKRKHKVASGAGDQRMAGYKYDRRCCSQRTGPLSLCGLTLLPWPSYFCLSAASPRPRGPCLAHVRAPQGSCGGSAEASGAGGQPGRSADDCDCTRC